LETFALMIFGFSNDDYGGNRFCCWNYYWL